MRLNWQGVHDIIQVEMYHITSHYSNAIVTRGELERAEAPQSGRVVARVRAYDARNSSPFSFLDKSGGAAAMGESAALSAIIIIIIITA